MADQNSVMSYEQARDELVDVVRRLEAGGATLEESLALWERGEELAGVCRRWLEGARARLDAALAAEESREARGAQESGGAAGEGLRSATEEAAEAEEAAELAAGEAEQAAVDAEEARRERGGSDA